MEKTKLRNGYLIAAGGVWIYLMLRAWFIPPVHDEAATFFHYINHGEFMPGQALWDANNHILNSFLSKYFVKLFGVNTFSIRLTNLLFFPVYAWFLYKLSMELKHIRMQALLLLTGMFMHGFVEYFAYSRGYGMSMGILMGALSYSYQFFSKRNVHLLIPAILLFWLATLSNLTLQNTSLLFFGIAGLYMLFAKFQIRERLLGIVYLVIAGAAMLPFVILSLKMKEGGLLYYAADEDFWTAVITSFTQMFFGSRNILLKIFWLVWAGIFICLTLSSIPKLKANWDQNRARLLFPLLFFGNLLGIFAMHYLMDVNFPSDRTGMHLVLYLFIGCIFLADTGKRFQQILVVIPALIFTGQFVVGANMQYSTYWKNEHLPERFWTRIYEESQSGKYISNPTVGGYRIRTLVWAWYNFKHDGLLQNSQYTNYYNGFEDYQIFSVGDYQKHNDQYDSLDRDEISGVVLARRKTFLTRDIYVDSTGYTTPENFTGEFYNLFETFSPDSFINHSWLIEADIKLYSLATPPKIRFVTSMSDKDGNDIMYDTSPLHWLKKEFRPEDNAVTVKLLWYQVPPETKRIVVYLWNINQEAYTLQNASLRIYKVR